MTSGSRPGPWAGELTRLVDGVRSRNGPRPRQPGRSTRGEPHAGRTPNLGPRSQPEGSAGPAVRRDGRDDRAGGCTRGDTRSVPDRTRAGRAHKWVRYEEAPVCLDLRGQRVSETATSGSGSASSIGERREGTRRRDPFSRRSRSSASLFLLRPGFRMGPGQSPYQSIYGRVASMAKDGCSTARRSRPWFTSASSPNKGSTGRYASCRGSPC